MKQKKDLVISIIEIILGFAIIIPFIIIALSGESILKWIIALIFACIFVYTGITGIIDYIKQNDE